MMTGLEREVQPFPEAHDVRVERCSVFKISEKITCKHESVDQWRNQEFCSREGEGGVQQIQLRTEDRENGDLGAVAP